MAKNLSFGEPPVFNGNVEQFVKETANYLRTVHQDVYGLNGTGGSLDGENITSVPDPGVADGTLPSVTTVVNNLVASFKTSGTVDS
jgi:hypothetical protein